MTQEDKNLLLKDLCARLPYGVRMKGVNEDFNLSTGTSPNRLSYVLNSVKFSTETDFKPYLRPMSSMTEEEKEEWHDTFDSVQDYVPEADDYDDNWHEQPGIESYDWLNEHHFDYRGLIPKGLALEATEDMY